MKSTISKMLNNNTTYYIIVPFLILILGWIYNWYDKKSQDITIMKGKKKRECPFFRVYIDFAGKVYSCVVIVLNVGIFFTLEELHIEILMWMRMLCFSMVCGAGLIVLIFQIKFVRYRIELLKHKVGKILFFVLTDVLYSMIILIVDYEDYKPLLAWVIIISALFILVPIFSDNILIYSNKYVSVILNDGKEINDIQIDKIKIKRKWMIINKTGKNEIRIRDSSVVRSNYYGEEYMKVYCPILKWLKLEVSEEELMELEKEMSEDK